jgi:UDP-N-acetylmuramoyl-tripeptide--D-alanyl-D-alanine ligase
MKPFLVSDILKIINGRLIKGSDDILVEGAAGYIEMIDKPNMLLFLRRTWCVEWDNIRNNLPCVVVTEKLHEELSSISNCTIIKVEDIDKAYWRFAEYYRNLFNIPVIAVTGTCGKSTTKDMIKHILASEYNVAGTYRSANSRTMHFSYLLGIDETTDAAAYETPVGEPGDLMNCCKYFKPTIGIITNIGIDHLSGCGTLENYIKAKAEILKGLPINGVIILNSDDENIKKIKPGRYKKRKVYFGIENPCDFRGTNIQFVDGGMSFLLTFNNLQFPCFIPGYGIHQVYNALAALAAVHELGFDIKKAIDQLRSFENLPLHLKLHNSIKGSQMLDDTWNINPNSLEAAIDVLANIAKGRKKIALIGDIDQLGDSSLEIHRQVGCMIANLNNIDVLITVGSMAAEVSKSALENNFSGRIFSFPNTKGVYELLINELNPNTLLLIKSAGSRDPDMQDLKHKLI